MTPGALIALAYSAVEPLPGDRDALVLWAAWCVDVARRGLWGVA